MEHIKNTVPDPEPTLLTYPELVVRLSCAICPRRGAYRLARLAAWFGADAKVSEVVYQLSADCPYHRPKWRKPPRQYEPRCGARIESSPP